MNGRCIAAAVCAICIGLTTSASAASGKSFLAAKAVKAFVCATYAAKAELASEEDRLVFVGYQAGKDFLEAVDEGEVTEEDFRTRVPVEFAQSMAGPAHDFILGRVYETTREDTLVRLLFESEDGRSLYFGDRGSVRARADLQYRSSFCELIE